MGFSFLLTDISTESLDPFNLNAVRFLVAFFVAVIFTFSKLRNISKETLKWSVLLGCILAVMYACMNIGVKNTTLFIFFSYHRESTFALYSKSMDCSSVSCNLLYRACLSYSNSGTAIHQRLTRRCNIFTRACYCCFCCVFLCW